MITLRAWAFIDKLQPQLASFIGTLSRGFLPLPEQASLHVEVSPGMAVNQALDIALKATEAVPGMLVVERSFGLLEIHHHNHSEVLAAGKAILDFYQISEKERIKPRVISDQTIRSITSYHSQLLNKIRFGSMIVPGESLFILETEPAGYIAVAANEAEKAADVKLVDLKSVGAFGRLYMSGNEAMIDSARSAALACIQGMTGKSI
ncbi:MAG TPA: hypothetical protein DC049_09635 [Spirochaetia bacterium]|nr:hypothetical protein [Spirochaetia bacterium]